MKIKGWITDSIAFPLIIVLGLTLITDGIWYFLSNPLSFILNNISDEVFRFHNQLSSLRPILYWILCSFFYYLGQELYKKYLKIIKTLFIILATSVALVSIFDIQYKASTWLIIFIPSLLGVLNSKEKGSHNTEIESI